MKFLAISSIILLFVSCAGVRITNTAPKTEGTQPEGFKFYYPKPFLMVETTCDEAGKSQRKSSIVYMPDLARPAYAKIKNGLGTNDFSMELSNGVVSSIGVKTDSKIPELLGLIPNLLESVKTIAAAGTCKPQTTLFEIEYSNGKYILTEFKAN